MKTVWPRRKLEDVCQFRGGGTPSKSVTRFWLGDIPWVSPKDMKSEIVSDSIDHISSEAIDRSATSLIPKDAVLMVVRSGILARTVPIAITGRDLAINQDLKALCPNEQVYPRFLYYLLDSKIDVLLSMVSRGATVHRLMTEQIRSLDFILPPLAEQHRLVRILDEALGGLATATANAEKNLLNARALFETHLQSVFTKRSKGWDDRKLYSLCREITVGYVGPMAREYKESGVTFLRSQNIRPFRVSLENVLFISREFDEKIAKSRLRPGDVAVVRTGYPGTAAVIPASLPEVNCADLVIVRPSREVEPQFLAAFFNSSYGKQHVSGKVVGAAQKHFNIGAAKETVLHLPPLQEQRRIIAKFDGLATETQRLESISQRKLAALGELKKSLLHEAFSGKL